MQVVFREGITYTDARLLQIHFFVFLHIGSTLPLVGWPPSECLIIERYVSVWGCLKCCRKNRAVWIDKTNTWSGWWFRACAYFRPQKWNDDLNWHEHCSAGWLKHQPVVYVIWWLWCYMLYQVVSFELSPVTQSLPGQLFIPAMALPSERNWFNIFLKISDQRWSSRTVESVRKSSNQMGGVVDVVLVKLPEGTPKWSRNASNKTGDMINNTIVVWSIVF